MTAIGKRVELISHLKTQAEVIGADCSSLNVAKNFTDGFCLIPRVSDPGYITALLEICEKEKPDYLIPLLEDEFDILAKNREKFSALGTNLLLSDENVLDICKDKIKTAAFFEKYEIPAPKTYDLKKESEISFPVIVKPSKGMGSAGVFEASDDEDLKYALKKTEEPIVQEKLTGREFTMDVLCDNDGNVIYIVPRERLEVKSGEVVKSRVELNEAVIDISKKVMEALKKEGSIKGPFTLQCFADDKEARMLEINPRFGGGVPLSFAAGADYAKALLEMLEGRSITKNGIKELTMLRYDTSFFTEG